MNSSFYLNVNITNPGEVFAACGILELVSRVAEKGTQPTGWFESTEDKDTHFHIQGENKDGNPLTLGYIINQLKNCKITGDSESKEGPLKLEDPFNFLVDWRKPYPQNPDLKTWAGGMTIAGILEAAILTLPKTPTTDILSFKTTLEKKGESKGKKKLIPVSPSRFNVISAERTLDIGFSLNKLKNKYTQYPAVALELFALIGLQRFCPVKGLEKHDKIYNVWSTPLPVNIASLAVNQYLCGINQTSYKFTMFLIDIEGRHKSFNTARKIL